MDQEPTRIITRAKCTATHKGNYIETMPALDDIIQLLKPIKRGYKSCKTKTCFDWDLNQNLEYRKTSWFPAEHVMETMLCH